LLSNKYGKKKEKQEKQKGQEGQEGKNRDRFESIKKTNRKQTDK
jgi:hypothetical protein